MFLLEGAYFVSFCSLYAYTVTILLDYGYTEVQCGYITMLQYLVMMIAGPIYGRLIDRSISPKWLFIILVAGGMIVTPLLPFCFGRGFLWTMLSFSLISALDYCASSVFDTWTNQMTLRDSTIDYGNIRSAGSIFYATTALISGYLIAPLGINFLFWLHMGALGLSILLALPLSDPNKLPLLHPEQDTFQKILSCCQELEQCLSEHTYGWDVLCTALLSQILVMLNQEKAVLSAPSFSNPIPPLVSEIYDYIDKNFTDTLSVSQLAVHFHHNADYLTRVFQRFSGYTIKQFILLKRISYAKELLQKGYLPNDVCFLCGFQNYSNFSRCFHNHLGLSPRKYQQSLAERTL